jgi:excinuclease ABC subunit C
VPDFDSAAFLKSLSPKPGVYQMFDADGRVLYVGKARRLKSRLASYFRGSGLSARTVVLVSRIAHVEVTVTASETEALLLEQNLIKAHRPPFNIVLRDDKSYPYIFLSEGEAWPRLAFHRGARRRKGQYFGPYPSAGAVRESLSLLQKMFQVRQCEDSFFSNRTRPCLQYQIKRCSAPCVEAVDPAEYAESVRHTRMFLEGRSAELKQELASDMERAAERLEFERAAQLRDRLARLQRVQERQDIETGDASLDVIAVALRAGVCCAHVLFIRDGRVLGSKSYFTACPLDEDPAQALAAFLPQFYIGQSVSRDVPPQIVISEPVDDAPLLAGALGEAAGRRVTISHRVRAARARWLELARRTAEQNLGSHLLNRQQLSSRFEELQELLGVDEVPQRIECFDISHSSGEATVASCVVFDSSGPLKSDYRRFNIDGITRGDDYAAMRQALQRRYTRLKRGEGKMPDLLLIDGGPGQVRQAEAVLEELQVAAVRVVGVAKGTTRKAGFETLVVDGRQQVPPADSPALHLIQQIRDEAHRFAVTGHKQRRDRARRDSPLQGIAGVGPKRRRELLRHFGGLQGVQRASIDELLRVPGISRKTAESIYAALHHD